MLGGPPKVQINIWDLSPTNQRITLYKILLTRFFSRMIFKFLVLPFILAQQCDKNKCSVYHDGFYYTKDHPIVFIGGYPRSGTTLMRVLIEMNKNIRCGLVSQNHEELSSNYLEKSKHSENIVNIIF